MKWTPEQEQIVTAPPGTKILVEAGPGTGKTAVACGRVAYLLAHDVNPSDIMMVSFTRTAVAEMRNRIQAWSNDGLVSSVNITTLDSAAFRFGMSCGAQYEQLMGSFEGNIANILKSFQEKNATLLEYLWRLEHVILDEAQDLTASRTKLATILLDHLKPNAGVTIFADGAQAIYGFTNDLDDKAEAGENFLADYPFRAKGYKINRLEKIHRTDDKRLLELFGGTRGPLFDDRVPGKEKPMEVLKKVKEQGKSLGQKIQEISLKNGDLVLFRKRVSARMAGQFHEGPVRLRLPGYPAAVFAWVGLVFSGWAEPEINVTQFAERWKQNVPVELRQGWTGEKAWALLFQEARAPRERVDLRKLRGLVARTRPPVELCHQDSGTSSKGKIDPKEEARVYYVGATRVKKEFFHGVAQTMVSMSLKSDIIGKLIEQRDKMLLLNKIILCVYRKNLLWFK